MKLTTCIPIAKIRRIVRVYLSVTLAFILSGTGVENWVFAADSPFTPYDGIIPYQGQPLNVQDFYKPCSMLDVVPNRPVAAHDKNGNRLYYTPSGKLALTVYTDGKQEFTLKGQTITKDAKGNITSITKAVNNTGKKVRENEKGEVLGYQQTGFGGKVIAEYDAQGNLTKSYQYNKYGKSLECVIDEMTQTKTTFNTKGQMLADIDFEGNEVAWYKYDATNRLVSKTDGYGNKTYYDKTNNPTHTEDSEGRMTAKYNYVKDTKGNTVLYSVEDIQTKNITYFDNGKQTVTKNAQGTVVKDYSWDGTTLAYTFDRERNETTWYDINGKQLYTSQNDTLVNKWLYYKGQLVGMWDQSSGSTTLFKNQREEIKIETGNEPPTAELVQKWIQEGLIEKMKSSIDQMKQ